MGKGLTSSCVRVSHDYLLPGIFTDSNVVASSDLTSPGNLIDTDGLAGLTRVKIKQEVREIEIYTGKFIHFSRLGLANIRFCVVFAAETPTASKRSPSS